AGRPISYTNLDALLAANGFEPEGQGHYFTIPNSTFTSEIGFTRLYGEEDPPPSLQPSDDAVLRGVTDPFYHRHGSETHVDPNGFCAFMPQPGRFEKFRWNCAGAKIRESDGTVYVYSAFFKRQDDRQFANRFELPHGARGFEELSDLHHEFVRVQFKARLERVEYPDGNQVAYKYDRWGRLVAVRDVLGRCINFYHTEGEVEDARIYRIECFESGDSGADARVVDLEYSTYGDKKVLSGVRMKLTDYPGGHGTTTEKVWQMSYSLSSYPRSMFKPRISDVMRVNAINVASPEDVQSSSGVPYFTAAFSHDDPTQWMIDYVELSGVRNGHALPGASGHLESTYERRYQGEIYPGAPADVAWYSVYHTDPRGNATEHVFDHQGNEIQTVAYGAGGPFVTTRTYDRDGVNYPCSFHLLYRVDEPRGNFETYYYQYDAYAELGVPPGQADMFQFGNLLWKESYDWSGVRLAREEYTYEPFFNQVLTAVSPRGLEPGGDPADFTTAYAYDFQEQSAAGLDDWLAAWEIDRSGFGPWYASDVNGDGILTQTAGKVIRIDYPTVKQGIAAEGGNQASSVLYRYNGGGQVVWEQDELGTVKEYSYYPPENPDGEGTSVPPPVQVHTGGGYLYQVVLDPSGLDLATTYFYDYIGNVTCVEDPEGHRAVSKINDWDEVFEEVRGAVDRYGVPLAGATDYEWKQYDFDANGNITEMRIWNDNPETGAATGNWVRGRFQYDVLDQLRRIEWDCFDPVSSQTTTQVSQVFYDQNSNLRLYVKPNLSAVSATYNERNLGATKTRHGNPWQGEYVPLPHADDATLSFWYDANGNLAAVTDGVGDTYSLGYDGLNRRVSLTDPTGTFSQHEFDAAGNIVRATVLGKHNVAGATAILKEDLYWYDEKDRLYEVQNMFFTLDDGGTRLPVTSGAHPGFTQTRLGLDAKGNVRIVEDDRSNRAETVYDRAGRESYKFLPPVLVSSPDPDCRNYTHFTYDGNGNVVQVEEHEFTDDGSGSVLEEVFWTEKSYDALNRLLTVSKDPQGFNQTLRYQYDSMGNVIREIDPKGFGLKNFYDTAKRLVRTERGWDSTFGNPQLDPGLTGDGLITKTMVYDGAGNLLSEEDDRENVTSYVYDNLNRRREVHYADGTYEVLELRPDDLVETFRAFDGTGSELFRVESTYLPGKKKSLEEVVLPLDSAFSGVKRKQWDYDGLGRVLVQTAVSLDPEAAGSEFRCGVERRFDSLDNVVREIQTVEESADGWSTATGIVQATVEAEYDGLKNRTQVSTDRDAYTADYAFDALNRIARVDFGPTYQATEYMGPGGRIFKKSNGNGTWTEVGPTGYDSLRRPTRIHDVKEAQPSPETLTEFRYGYDLNDNRTSQQKLHTPSRSQTYSYD
ncbi:MAG: hypothetical protein AB1744_05865, partial [Candidatus Zixiibacteriota bacterium]